ncbi:MAG: PqqD family protein [Pseudomonadota bacterium]|nr:PqqD family protein [Pseudomonadota bacterium]
MKIPQHVMARQVGDDCVMLDLANGTYYGLNPVGAHVWQLMVEGKSLGEICAAVVEQYEVSPEGAQADVLALLQELQDLGLVEPGLPSDPG